MCAENGTNAEPVHGMGMTVLRPRQCLRLQLERRFAATLGVAELETVARHVMVDLAYQDRWALWLCAADYGRTETDYNDWRSNGWKGSTAYDRTFDDWVEFYDDEKKRFQVSADFVSRMHYWDAEDDPSDVCALATHLGLTDNA